MKGSFSMHVTTLTPDTLLLLSPIILVSLGLLIFCLVDLLRPARHVKGGNKWLWALVIVVGGLIGQLVYLFVGREEME
jgi:hypothetical protein